MQAGQEELKAGQEAILKDRAGFRASLSTHNLSPDFRLEGRLQKI